MPSLTYLLVLGVPKQRWLFVSFSVNASSGWIFPTGSISHNHFSSETCSDSTLHGPALRICPLASHPSFLRAQAQRLRCHNVGISVSGASASPRWVTVSLIKMSLGVFF